MLGAVAGLVSREGVESAGRRERREYQLPRLLSTVARARSLDEPMIVAIDGPAGAGKSTVARKLAERLGFRYLDTGRDVPRAHLARAPRGVPLGDGEPLGELARRSPVTFDEAGRVFDRRHDVTSAIRQARIDRMVPVVARHHEVREVMRERQRELAAQGNAVIEGRDIGTVVAPERRGEGLPRGRPGGPRAPPPGRAARHRRRRARDRPAHARRVRPRAHAAGRGRRADRHDATSRSTTSSRGSRSSSARARVAIAVNGDFAWALGRRYMGWPAPRRSRAPAPTAATACRATGGCVSRSTTCTGSTSRSSASLSPRNINFVAKVEAVRVPGARPLPRVARHDRASAAASPTATRCA